MIDKHETVKRAFTIEYKVDYYFKIEPETDLLLLGLANIRDNNGWTALMRAAYLGREKIINLLIQAGADLNVQDNRGLTALMWANNGNKEIVDLLIQSNADINIKDNDGTTALIYAAYKDHPEIVGLLIQAGADVNTKDNNDRTALMRASDPQIKDMLKRAGAIK